MTAIVHKDDMLVDPLPQPYRYLNKLLLQLIEDSIELAEGGGTDSTRHAFIGHNLRLTKVGKLPTTKTEKFLLSTTLTQYEITIYDFYSNTPHLLIGTTTGNIIIYNLSEETALFNYSITAIGKSVQPKPILHFISFPTDYDYTVIVFATDEACFIMYMTPNFQPKNTVEIDISGFVENISFSNTQTYLIVTDGNGKTLVYDCHTPPELVPTETPTKSQGSKPIQLEPILDIEKCPISDGPVTSESQLSQKAEDPKKKVVKKKPPPPKKSTKRASTPETASSAPLPENHATVNVFGKNCAVRFGLFPIIYIYGDSIIDFPLPCPITAAIELGDRLVIGLENGSICVLNITRKTIESQIYPKNRAIIKFHIHENILLAYSNTKTISAFALDNYRIKEKLYECSDDDILETHISGRFILTFNAKSSDINVCNALSHELDWNERKFVEIPNISVVEIKTGKYYGTIGTPINLAIEKIIFSDEKAVFIYNDPIECRVSASEMEAMKKTTAPKNAPKRDSKRASKPSRMGRKQEEVKEEPEQTFVMKRQIIGIVDLKEMIEGFNNAMIAESKKSKERRQLIKSRSVSAVQSTNDISKV